MSSSKQPKHVFTPQELKALDLALVGALATVKELGLRRKGLRGALRRRLFDVAGEGITDPEILQNRVLKSMNLDKIAN